MTPQELKDKSDELVQKVKDMEYEAEVLDAHLRASCSHAVLSQAPRSPSRSGWFKDMPAMRICETCGVEEDSMWEQWKYLTGRAYTVTDSERHALYKFRRGSLAHFGKDGVIYVGSTPSSVTNDQIINADACGKEVDTLGHTCVKLAGHKTYPCEAGI